MVPAKESQTCQQFSAWNSSYSDHMAFPQLEKNYGLPRFPLPKRTPDVTFPGQCLSNLPGLKIGQQDAVGGFFKLAPPYCNISNPTGNPHLKDSQYMVSHGLGFTGKPFDPSCAPQKQFLIFDQSGNHTRLFFSPSFSPHDRIFASKTPASANGPSQEVATAADKELLMKPMVEEKWDENHLTDGEDEMLEDTEEINALLYSDSDDDEYDDEDGDEGENDEVTSTRYSPFTIEEGCGKDKILNELTEEVASSDDSPKRQRLLDGKYKKSSLESAESPMKRAISSGYEDDVESSCAGNRNSYDDIGLNKRVNKVKIRQALKMLETIIPGLDSKDPFSIIDKAVSYLKSMKTEAEALGLSYPESNSATSA